MRINNYTSPSFGKFRIVGNTAKDMGRMGGSQQFLQDQTNRIAKLGEKYHTNFERPLEDRILAVIKRQQDNPFDILITSKWGKTPDKDVVTIELLDLAGKIRYSERAKDSLGAFQQDGKMQLSSEFYRQLDKFEEMANESQKSYNIKIAKPKNN